MTQSSCKRDTKSRSHPGMKLTLVQVFLSKHPLTALQNNDYIIKIASFKSFCFHGVDLPFTFIFNNQSLLHIGFKQRSLPQYSYTASQSEIWVRN